MDEVNSLKFDTASNEIELFAVKYPSVNIFVTCRTNFNPFSSGDINSNEYDKFKELYLNEINQDDIKEYIFKECNL